MKYNPENELTDEQLKELSEDEFFEYLDSKAAHLKKSIVPLDQYHVKRYAAVSMGGTITTKELRKAKEIGKKGEWAKAEKIKEAASKITAKVPDLYVKHHKTDRSQWFD
ncbi:MAG: hypothetical protein RLZZ196_2784 [Bacteroidota bacterium]|jgi:hypothetical protein